MTMGWINLKYRMAYDGGIYIHEKDNDYFQAIGMSIPRNSERQYLTVTKSSKQSKQQTYERK